MESLEEPREETPQEPTGDVIWDDLLGSIEYEEPPEEEPTTGLLDKIRNRFAKKGEPTAGETDEEDATKPARQGLTGGQKIILLFLAIAVIAAYIVLATIVKRSIATSGPPTSPEADTVITETIVVPTATPTVPAATPTPDPEAMHAATPLPQPKVATQYDNEIAADPDNVELRLKRGTEYLNLHAFDAALTDFEHAMEQDEKRAETYIGIGHANTQLLRLNEAENAYLTAVALDESLPEPRFGLGRLYYLQGRYEAAARSFDIAAEIDPTYAEAEAWLAIASARLKDLPEAQGAATRAYSLTQDSAIIFIARAWAALATAPPDIDAAQSDLLYAQNLDRFDFEVLTSLAQFYTEYRPERLAEAEQLALSAVGQWATSPLERARGLHTLGRVYLALERKQDAFDALSQAADLATLDGDIVLGGLADDLERALEP